MLFTDVRDIPDLDMYINVEFKNSNLVQLYDLHEMNMNEIFNDLYSLTKIVNNIELVQLNGMVNITIIFKYAYHQYLENKKNDENLKKE